MKKHYPLALIALLFSLVFHYLFINYFPVEWWDRWSPFAISPELGKRIIITSQIEATLMGAEGEEGESEGNGQEGGSQGEGVLGEALEGIDQEKWGDLLSRLEENTGFSQGFDEGYDDIIDDGRVSKSYVYRERPHEDIVIKDVFPTIHNIDQTFSEILKAAPQKLDDYNERNDIIDTFRSRQQQEKTDLTIESLSREENRNLGALDFPEAARQAFFDKTLPDDKTQQLSNFINRYFQYDPNEGDLPIATRELYFKNLERLLYSFSSDQTYLYLDFYLENLNKEDFLYQALNQAARLDGTKTATELLFTIERIYEIQQRAWKAYFEFDGLYADIPEEKRLRLRVETLRRVNERYKDVLSTKELDDFTELEQKYLQRRYEIIEYIIHNSPEAYRVKDALFEQAVILWDMGNSQNNNELKKRAISQWQALIDEARKTNFQSQDNDFLNQVHLRGLEGLLYVYERDSGANKTASEQRINTFLRQRYNERLAKKRAREEKLLWPKESKQQ